MSARVRIALGICLILLVPVITFPISSEANHTYLPTLASTKPYEDKFIAFISTREKGGYPTIFLMNADGSNQHPLRKSEEHSYVSMPAWSPNGKNIVFSVTYDSNRDTQIFIMTSDGTTQQIISIVPSTIDAAPTWSPDGKQIAFVSNNQNSSGLRQIYLMNADGSNQHRLTQTQTTSEVNEYDPHWLPDGKRIFFRTTNLEGSTTSDQIHIAEIDGSNDQNIILPEDASVETAVLSPTGTRIAFKSTEGYICTVNSNGGNEHCLTNIANGYGPSWAPNESYIAFAVAAPETKSTDIDIVSNDGQTIHSLIHSIACAVNLPLAWSFNGNQIAFPCDANHDGTTDLYIVGIDGSNEQQLTADQINGANNFDVVWQP